MSTNQNRATILELRSSCYALEGIAKKETIEPKELTVCALGLNVCIVALEWWRDGRISGRDAAFRALLDSATVGKLISTIEKLQTTPSTILKARLDTLVQNLQDEVNRAVDGEPSPDR